MTDNKEKEQGQTYSSRHSLAVSRRVQPSASSATEGSLLSPEEKIEQILAIVVEQRSTAKNSEKIGNIRIFDIEKSPDTEILRHDPSIKKVFTAYDLREALSSPIIPIIMVPETAAINRMTVADLCEHYALPKTIFCEFTKS